MTGLTLEMMATLCAALFAGAAVYINVAEHPARLVPVAHASEKHPSDVDEATEAIRL